MNPTDDRLCYKCEANFYAEVSQDIPRSLFILYGHKSCTSQLNCVVSSIPLLVIFTKIPFDRYSSTE